MVPPRVRALIALLSLLVAVPASAAVTPWGFDLSAFVYAPKNEDVFTAPTLAADRGTLHLEARYNYEDLETGSFFVGRNIAFEDQDVNGTVVPVLGLVVGNTAGIAPGVNIDLAWGRFEFTTETEVVIELPDSEESFLYSWVEGTLEPVHGLRLGVAGQRTKVKEIGLDLRRGPMLSLSAARGWLGVYWFDPDLKDQETWVFAGGITF
jgi:hypothetical protein